MNPLVSRFAHGKKTDSPEHVRLLTVLEGIRTGKWATQIAELRKLTGKAYTARKIKLPGFTCSGTFDSRCDAGFQQHSELVQLDIDAQDNPGLSYGKMWEVTCKCPSVFTAFQSPSGKGVKALIHCPGDREQHAGSHAAAVQWFADHGVAADTRVSALSQLCFVSHDPDLFIREKPERIVPIEMESTHADLHEYEEHRSQETILRECRKQFPQFDEVWGGNWEGHFGSPSEADYFLIAALRENCFSNEMVAEMFAESGLYREEKWNGRTRDYVFHTLKNCHVVHDVNLLTPLPEDPENPTPERKRKGWSWRSVADVEPWTVEEEDDYIIKRMLLQRSMSAFYGAPGTGKTFIVLDILAAIASGREWNGRKVIQGGVAYFGLEGEHRIKRRIQALKLEGKMQDGDPFFQILCGAEELNMMKPEHVKKVVDIVRAIEAETGQKIVVIVIDTLAKATAGGDENSSKDMGTAMGHARAIMERTGCHVGVVHHTGKDASKGMRGSTALLGGLDSVFEVCEDENDPEVKVFRIRKQRDEKKSQDGYFRLKVITLGMDRDGEAVDTCVTQFLTGDEIPVKQEKGDDSLKILGAIPDKGATFAEMEKLTGIPKSTLSRKM